MADTSPLSIVLQKYFHSKNILCPVEVRLPSATVGFVCLFVFAVVGFEFRASCFLHRCSTIGTMPQPFFAFIIFQTGSHIFFLGKWDPAALLGFLAYATTPSPIYHCFEYHSSFIF
jgi:hypothetical protein